MMVRRVLLSGYRLASKIVADARGVPGEDFPTEVFWPWPLSANPREGQAGRAPMIEGHELPDNRISLPASTRDYLPDSGGFGIRLSDSVSLEMHDSGRFVLKSSQAIEIDAPDLIINGQSFAEHFHGGVMSGGSASGPVL